MTAIRNSVLDKVEKNEVALGIILRLIRSGEVARIAQVTGYDFLFIDAQHALFSPGTVAELLEAAANAGIAALVRTRGCRDPNIPLYLDAGAAGLIIPDVDTPEQAREAVMAAKFPPLGKRSVPGLMRLLDFRPVPSDQATALANARTLLICMIEGRKGVENADAIAKVDGVDGLHVGCIDLLTDLGSGYALDDPRFVEAVKGVLTQARRNGLIAGIGGDRDEDRVAGYLAAGANFVTAQLDMALFMQAAEARSAKLREIATGTRKSGREWERPVPPEQN